MIPDRDFILVSTRWESTIVYLEEILYIERRLRKILVFTLNEEYEFYDDMEDIIPKLGENYFSLTSGVYVNLDYVKSVKDRRLIFDGGMELFLSQRSFIGLKRRHNAYYRLRLKNK